MLTYEYGLENRLTRVRQGTTDLATTFTYGDDGALGSFATGSVLRQTSYDLRKRVKTIEIGSLLHLTYNYDSVGNVTSIVDPRPGKSATYTYDPLYRLQTATVGAISQGWTYDAAGNRLTETGTFPTTFTYQGSTQRLTSASGALTESFGYNALGQLTSDSRGTYTYTPTGRLATVSGPVTASYGHDADDERFLRTVNGHATFTIRGAGPQVLSEYQAACGGAVWTRDLLYAGGMLIGGIRAPLTQPSAAMTSTGVTVAENAGPAGVQVQLTTPNGAAWGCAVTVSYAVKLGTATAADVSLATGTVTFACRLAQRRHADHHHPHHQRRSR